MPRTWRQAAASPLPGQHVLGTTTPLYTLLAALAAALFGPGAAPNVWGKALNVVADDATCLLLFLWLRKLGRPRIGLLAAALYALDPHSVNWNGSGMETGLVTLAGVAALTAFAYGRLTLTASALAVLVLLRFDGLLPAGALFASALLERRRIPPRALAAFFLPAALWAVAAFGYFGSPLPTSAQAKFVIYPRFVTGPFPHLGLFARQIVGSGPGAVIAGAFLAGTVLIARRNRALLPALIWVLLYFLVFATSKLMLFGWYLVPPLPVYFVVAAYALAEGMNAIRQRFRLPQTLLPAFAAACLVLWSASAIPGLERRLA